MSTKQHQAETTCAKWARFRFSIVGPLLAAPPQSGELKSQLEALSEKSWQHPITGLSVQFSVSTLERWLYRAKKDHDPVKALETKRRSDSHHTRKISIEQKRLLQGQYREHPTWSYQLHYDNLVSLVAQHSLGPMASYSAILRYMKTQGWSKQRRVKQRHTLGAQIAQERLETREVRSFEVDYVHALWHLDFHQGSLKILGKQGQWHRPLLLAIIDDHSRLVCHIQWYLDETAESLVHGFKQALQKRGLPRALMSDNGAAMTSSEFTQGLERLSILHQPTLPYSPYQNAKQEVFWVQVEGRLLAMLEGEPQLTLALLNQATLAWVEFEYHKKLHAEIASTPLARFLEAKNVGRPCPDTAILNQAFSAQVKRKQRRCDGTFTLEGHRFEVPNVYRHFEELCVRYARWDLSQVILVDPHTNTNLATLYPQDKSANATGLRRTLPTVNPKNQETPTSTGIAPLLKQLMADYAATGLPPAYLAKDEGEPS